MDTMVEEENAAQYEAKVEAKPQAENEKEEFINYSKNEIALYVQELKDKRILLEKSKELYDKALEDFKNSNQDTINLIEKIKKTEIPNLEEKIKDKALLIYDIIKEKDIESGVKIQNRKSLEFDRSKALEWAKNHKLALSLDEKSFKKIAELEIEKENSSIDFVEVKNIPIATIPSTL